MLQLEDLYFAAFWWCVEYNVVSNPGIKPAARVLSMWAEMLFMIREDVGADLRMADRYRCPAYRESDESPWKEVRCYEEGTGC